jgi:beta-lactamase superfamily II metal-dependent hydrolase
MSPLRVVSLVLSLTAVFLGACADAPPPPVPAAVTITGAVRSADQPQGEGADNLGVTTGALASTGLAIIALDTAGNTIQAPIGENGQFSLTVAPNTSYTLNLLDTVRNLYIASFLYRTGSKVELALTVREADVALGECQVFNGEIWCDNGFFEPDASEPVEVPSDMYGRVRATVDPSDVNRPLVELFLGGTVVEYDLAPNPLNRFHVALSRHTEEGCNPPLLGVAEKVGEDRYLYVDRTYANDTCNATGRFQVMCSMQSATRCIGFIRVDIVSSGTDCTAFPTVHMSEAVVIDVLEKQVVTCPLPDVCDSHGDCDSGVCNNDVGFCAAVPPTATLRFHVFDVGNGQAVLAVTPSGKSILMDAGRPQSGRMVAAMIRRIVPRLDMLVLSHFDADHAGGAVPLMLGPDGYPGRRGVDDDRINGIDDEGEIGAAGSDDLKPAMVIDRGISPMPAGFDDYVRILGSTRSEGIAGEVFDFGDGVTMTVLTSNGRVAGSTGLVVDEENARSVGVLFRYGEFTLANLGDLPAGGLGTPRMEQLIVPAVIDDIPLDVHFLSHHGSKASSPPELLKALRPRVAIISVGDSERCGAGFNSYGLPAQEVLDAVNEGGTIKRIYQTGEGGASFSNNCVPEPRQVYPRNYGATPVAFSYSVFTIEATESRFRVSGLTFDDHYDAAGCDGDACSTCPPGYLEHPDDPERCVVDPCVPDPCGGRGVCNFIEIGSFACDCDRRFGGETCNTCAVGYAGEACAACDIGFVTDPGDIESCIDDPCAPEACNGRGACSVVAGGAAACACGERFAGIDCGACATGYAGDACAECAEGFVADPNDAGRCIADPCLGTPCGANGTCVVEGDGDFSCACLGNWVGATCNACATGYAGPTCDDCAAGFVTDPTAPGMCIPNLCTTNTCGGRGTCSMKALGAVDCACDGNFAGIGCSACAEGFTGATCEDCAQGFHAVAGTCAPNRTISACGLVTLAVWASATESVDIAAYVDAGDASFRDGPLAGVLGRVCWRPTSMALPIAWQELVCAESTWRMDDARGDVVAASMAFPASGTWRYIAGFSGDGGATWTACDVDGRVSTTLKPGTASVFNLPNGGFEEEDGPLVGWVSDVGVDVEADIDTVHFGDRAVRLTRTSTNNADTDFTAAGVAVVAGQSYSVSMWFFDNDVSARANVVYAFFDANGAQVGATSFGGVYTTDQNVWQNIVRSVTAPVGAVTMRVGTRVYAQSGGAAIGGSVVLDDVAVIGSTL